MSVRDEDKYALREPVATVRS